jgi:hypothetical protein
MRAAAVAVLAVAALPATGLAQKGSEFLANTYTSGSQRHPSVAATASVFVVVWESQFQDGSSYGVYGQRFTSAPRPQKLGAEFLVNTASTAGAQRYPSAAMDSSGKFVVVWQSAPTNTFANVYGRRFDASGAPLGAQFRVNTYTTVTNGRRAPSVAAAADGSFVVAWMAYDGSYRIAAQRYGTNGAPLGSEFRANTSITGGQLNPAVAVAGDGSSFVIVWNNNVYSENHVFAQRYAGSGAKLGGEFRVNTYTGYPHFKYPSVAADSTGNFTVVWQSFRQISTLSNNDIFGQRYSSAGAMLGSEFLVNASGTSNDQERPRIASDSAGNLTVVWTEGQASYTVIGQRFLSTGAPLGTRFGLPTSGTSRLSGAVAASGNGFVVAWSAKYDGSGLTGDYGIFGKRYPGPGDVNGDGFVDVADVFYLINFLFASGPDPVGPGDVSGDGAVDVGDVFYLINYLFAAGPFPN